MTVHIAAHEVLAHLNRMGYHNVTAGQLKTFITDLKRLIKHDLKQCDCTVSSTTSTPDISGFASATDMSCDNKAVCDRFECCEGKPSAYVSRCPKHGEESDDADEESVNTEHVELKCSRRKNYCNSGNGELRPRSAFIKTWNVEGSASRRHNDPVALYHKYQLLWQQQKVPGDNAHVELRWNVREKMLGRNSHPMRVTNTAAAERLLRKKSGYSD